MNLAVIGSGGREHAICYKLKHSAEIKKLKRKHGYIYYIIPPPPGGGEKE